MGSDKLRKLEEKIEQCYILLARLEIAGSFDTPEYNEYKSILCDLINKEKDLIIKISYEERIKQFKELKNGREIGTSRPFQLGFKVDSIEERIFNLLETTLGDNALDYACILDYDRNKIMISMLDFMINNDYYDDIKKDLIFQKYNLLYLNMRNEYDFIIENNLEDIELETSNYRTPDFPAYPLIDKAILVLSSTDNISELLYLTDDFIDNKAEYVQAIFRILNILASLVLLESDLLESIYGDLKNLMEADITPESLKNLINELIVILDELRHNISWAR